MLDEDAGLGEHRDTEAFIFHNQLVSDVGNAKPPSFKKNNSERIRSNTVKDAKIKNAQ